MSDGKLIALAPHAVDGGKIQRDVRQTLYKSRITFTGNLNQLKEVLSKGNTPLRLSTFRLLQVRLVYYAFYNFAFHNFAWSVPVRHLVYLKMLQCRAHVHSYSGFSYWCSLLSVNTCIIDSQQMLCAIYIGSEERRVDFCRHRQRGEPTLKLFKVSVRQRGVG